MWENQSNNLSRTPTLGRHRDFFNTDDRNLKNDWCVVNGTEYVGESRDHQDERFVAHGRNSKCRRRRRSLIVTQSSGRNILQNHTGRVVVYAHRFVECLIEF